MKQWRVFIHSLELWHEFDTHFEQFFGGHRLETSGIVFRRICFGFIWWLLWSCTVRDILVEEIKAPLKENSSKVLFNLGG